MHKHIFFVLLTESIYSIFLGFPTAISRGTIRNQELVINRESVKDLMATNPPKVAEVECGAPKVCAKFPAKLLVYSEVAETQIVFFGLAMSLKCIILEIVDYGYFEFVENRFCDGWFTQA